MRPFLLGLLFLASAGLAEESWELNLRRIAGEVEGLSWLSASGKRSVLALSEPLLQLLKDEPRRLVRVNGISHGLLLVPGDGGVGGDTGGVAVLLPGIQASKIATSPEPVRAHPTSQGFFFLYETLADLVLAHYDIASANTAIIKSGLSPASYHNQRVRFQFTADTAVLIEGKNQTVYRSDGRQVSGVVAASDLSKAAHDVLTKVMRADDLTHLAETGQVPVSDWQEKMVKEMEENLHAKSKRSILVAGDAGLSPERVVNLLAKRIAKGQSPELRGWKVFQVDNLGRFGTEGEADRSLKKVVDWFDTLSHQKVILFFPDLQNLMRLGDTQSEGLTVAGEMASFLKSGRVILVGTTTQTGLVEMQRSDAFYREFRVFQMEEPTGRELLDLVRRHADGLVAEHRVKLSDTALDALVRLTAVHLPDEKHPGKDFDVLDRLAARHARANAEAGAAVIDIDEEKIRKVVGEISRRKTLGGGALEELLKPDVFFAELGKYILNRDREVKALHGALLRIWQSGRIRGASAARSQGVETILLTGPSGIGKTYLGEVLNKALKDRGVDWPVMMIEGNTLTNEGTAWKILGAPAGYKGYDPAGGPLYQFVKAHPEAIIIFDEFDKMDPEVIKVLYRILDDGMVPDGGKVRYAQFRGLIMLTANFGSKGTDQESYSPIEKEVANLIDQFTLHFRPEYTFTKADPNIVQKYFAGWPKPKTEAELQALVPRLKDSLFSVLEKSGRTVNSQVMGRIGDAGVEIMLHFGRKDIEDLSNRFLNGLKKDYAELYLAELVYTEKTLQWFYDQAWGEGGNRAFRMGARAVLRGPLKPVKAAIGAFEVREGNLGKGKRWIVDIDGKGEITVRAEERTKAASGGNP